MSYTNQNLGKDEKIILRGEISKIALVPNVLMAIVIFLLFAITGIGVMIFIGLVCAAIIVGVKIITINSIELSLTSKKVVGKTGVIATKVMDSPLNKINNISVEQGLGGKIFGYGKIVITTAAGNYNFNYISQPDVFRGSVMNQIDVFDEERIRKQAEQIAGAIKR